MIEKLLEDWLDNANETSYQPCFVHMLSARGYTVLHSTRHCSLEYGKDVLAIDPDGVPCAFQLKGKPSARITLNEFRSTIQDQLIQLMSQPIIYPGIDTEQVHRSFLVFNGFFDEEVHRAVDDLNRGPYGSKVRLLGRGELLEWVKESGLSLWPTEIGSYRDLLELFLYDGSGLLPLDRLAAVLERMLGLGDDDRPFARSRLNRVAPSAALFTGIATSGFAASGNHFAVASAWCIYCISLIGSADRANLSLDGPAESTLRLAEAAIKDALVALWEETLESENLLVGSPLTDMDVVKWRFTLLCGVLSSLWFFPNEGSEDESRRRAVETWIRDQKMSFDIWGEGAIPCIISFLFLLRRTDPSRRSDAELSELLKIVVSLNQRKSPVALADPYYGFEDIVRHRLGLISNEVSATLREESFAGTSYMAELVLHLAARERLKLRCRLSWPAFNRLGHKRFSPATSWQYCRLRCPTGMEETRYYPEEYEWQRLCRNADCETCDYLPEQLSSKPHLLLLWCILAPWRLTTEVGRVLSGKLPRP